MPFAAAISEHPIPTQAIGECVGELLERIGPGPDLAVLFVTAPHVGAMEDIARTVRATLGPHVLVGSSASSVIGGAREAEDVAAVSLWAGSFPGGVRPVRLELEAAGSGQGGSRRWAITGVPAGIGADHALVLLPDPYSFPADALLDGIRASHPGLAVIGGLASAARGPGGNRLVLDDRVHADGAVGVMIDADALATVVSQGCRPIGEPYTVTRSDGNVLHELGGRPALERLLAIIDALSPDDRALAARGLHAGVVIDERKLEFARGDFVIRNVLGADRSSGAVAVGDNVPVGATVQFQVRDAASADDDLRAMLAGHDADAALVFTCNGRGLHLFGRPNHDAEVVTTLLGTPAVAGMFCAGEIGPVAGRNYLHGFTASVALFRG